ncbi:hypothetical protein GCM10010172_71450 [Paractinoplanes ferrugineus]|uniref:Uncharacterized protein n=1 Tax=Paractinoplanes ferrugineus TaxID=113564 RepID=A0A919MJS2_9ACTN|nr:hypothetical protein [Actinoplanes ferrugineus]GIE15030.1 hypothetical protein Afe05nite_68700 [Actinoplanes ferrugineus]
MTVQLIGGEMSVWSDLDATHGPAPAGDPALRPLLTAITGDVLVAGPHAPELVDAIPAGRVTLLVRGVADAEFLAARYASRPGVTVCCGSLDKFSTTAAYDTVVALDGLDRLLTPEAADLTWDETLTRLLAGLSPQGRLLLRLENLFGVHRLLSLPPTPPDTEWITPDDRDPTRPLGPDAVRARLASAGVAVTRDYAAYPGALLSGPALTDPALQGFWQATLAAAAPIEPQLADPARLITGALRHHLADALAPAWIFLAGPASAGPAPDALIAAPAGPAPKAGAAGPAPEVGAAGPVAEVRREAGGRWTHGGVPVPVGRTLADLLLAACARRALPDVRHLVTAWQAGPAAGVPAAQVIVDADGDLHGLAPAGPPLRALRQFAASAIAGGHAHLWPAPADEASLTALLAGMTGRELDPRDVPAIPPPAVESVRELIIARDRLTRELADARAKHEFYERQLARRDHDLRRLRQLNAVLSATAPGRAANTLVGGLKAGRRAVRAVVRRARD